MMGLFHKQSRWEKLIEPVSAGTPRAAASQD